MIRGRHALAGAISALVVAFVATPLAGGATADAVPPTVSISAPAEGATVSGKTNVTFTATDDVAVATVTLYVESIPVSTWRSDSFEGGGIPSPLTASLDTTAYANGAHTVSVQAVDSSGRETWASLHLTFANPALVASYGFEDGSGTILRDGSGSGHFGVLRGGLDATGWSAGHAGLGLSFDGVDDSVDLTSLQTFYSGGFTLEAWVKKASSRGDEGIVGAWTYGAGGGPMLWVGDDGRYRLTLGNDFSTYVDSGRTPAVGTWEHVAGTWDGTTARFYLNGVETASLPFTLGQLGSSTLWKIGAYDAAGGNFDGSIDDVRMFRSARSAAEIQSDMGSAAAPDTTPPTVPSSFKVTGTTAASITSSWTPSTDNVRVRDYAVYRGGVKLGTTTATSYTFDTLTCATSYDLAVAAEDDAGNVSAPAALTASTAACPPPPGLLAAYSFEEGSGTTVGDSSGNARGASLAGGATWTTAGKSGGGLALDGVDGRVDLPTFSTFYKSAFTLEAWVKKTTAQGDAAIVGTWTVAGHGGPMLWVDGTGRYTLTLGTGLSNYLVSGRAVAPGTWQHVAGTYDGTTARIYVNGQLAASVPFSGNVGDSSTWRIGAYGSSVFGAFDGTLDEVRIYNRALSAGEIATDMGAAPPSVDAPPSAPTGFAVTAASATTIATSWQPSTDDVGVRQYQLYRDGVFTGLAAGTSYTFLVVPCGTPTTVAVEAVDTAGHVSPRTTIATSTAPCDTTTGLVARYAFDDGSVGGFAGGAGMDAGHTGGGVALDGISGRVDLPSLGTFYKTGFTLEAWIRRSSASSEAAIVGSWTYGDGGGSMLWIDHLSHHLRLTLGRDLPYYLDAGVGIPTGEWHHVAGTYDGAVAQLYLDGKVVATAVYTGNVGDSNTWRIGAYGATPTGFFAGTIDDVRIYSRALGSDQIAATMGG